jgi:hypothetical protein
MIDARDDRSPGERPITCMALVVGAVAGAVVIPLLTAGVMALIDQADPMCSEGGEGGIACAYCDLAVVMLSIPLGAVVGVLAIVLWRRRRQR